MIKRKLRWIAIACLVFIAAVTAFGFTGRDPYACIYAFPHTVMDPNDMPSGAPRVLIYAPKDAPAVLRAMKRDLTPEAGFQAFDERQDVVDLGMADQEAWRFERGSEMVRYAPSELIALAREIFGKPPLPELQKGGAVVLTKHEPTWAQSAWQKMMNFLHFS